MGTNPTIRHPDTDRDLHEFTQDLKRDGREGFCVLFSRISIPAQAGIHTHYPLDSRLRGKAWWWGLEETSRPSRFKPLLNGGRFRPELILREGRRPE